MASYFSSRLLEDADDYKAFEAAVAAGFDAEIALERELMLRLASLLWRNSNRYRDFLRPQVNQT